MNLFSRLLMVVGIAVAFAVGFWASGGAESHREQRVDSRRGVRMGLEGAAGENGSRKVIAGGSWPDVKTRVRKRWEASPEVWVDFELCEETRRLLEKTPVADLEAWLWELRLESVVDDERDIPRQLRDMILSVLVPRSAGPLIRSLAEHPAEDGEADMRDAMDYWTKHDPAAVLAWLGGDIPQVMKEDLDDYLVDAIDELAVKDPLAALAWLDGTVPQEIKEDLDYLREGALVELAGKDPAEFERRLAGVAPELRESVLESYACKRANAEDRSGLLERAARSPHGEAMALWTGLLRGEGSDDPERAYATLAALEISATDRAALDQKLVGTLLDGYFTAEEDRSGIMQGWVQRNPGLLVPEGISNSFKTWCRMDTERAVTWTAGQPPGPQYDTFAQVLIEAEIGPHGLDYPTAARLASLIGDPAVRADTQDYLKKQWQASDAAAADAWEKTLPIEDQKRLQPPTK